MFPHVEKELTPASMALPFSLQTKGPPKSPEQKSFPPPPAHNMAKVMVALSTTAHSWLHWELFKAGTWSNLKTSVKESKN